MRLQTLLAVSEAYSPYNDDEEYGDEDNIPFDDDDDETVYGVHIKQLQKVIGLQDKLNFLATIDGHGTPTKRGKEAAPILKQIYDLHDDLSDYRVGLPRDKVDRHRTIASLARVAHAWATNGPEKPKEGWPGFKPWMKKFAPKP